MTQLYRVKIQRPISHSWYSVRAESKEQAVIKVKYWCPKNAYISLVETI